MWFEMCNHLVSRMGTSVNYNVNRTNMPSSKLRVSDRFEEVLNMDEQ